MPTTHLSPPCAAHDALGELQEQHRARARGFAQQSRVLQQSQHLHLGIRHVPDTGTSTGTAITGPAEHEPSQPLDDSGLQCGCHSSCGWVIASLRRSPSPSPSPSTGARAAVSNNASDDAIDSIEGRLGRRVDQCVRSQQRHWRQVSISHAHISIAGEP